MNYIALLWFFSAFLWTGVMSFYSMQEMACISLNRLRLELAVRSGSQRATWIQTLLNKPTSLFGTTLVGVNVALVLGSESMRQGFCALGLNPNFSVFVQAPYVLIFGELVPMFAARLFPEHMVRLGSPFLWASSKILSPIAHCIDYVFEGIRRLFFKQTNVPTPHLQRDELRDLITVQNENYFDNGADFPESIVSRMFALKDREIGRIMVPIAQLPSLLSASLCGPSQDVLLQAGTNLAVIRNRQGRIVGYIQATDLLLAPESSSVGSICRPATFVGEGSTTIETLFRLKKEKGSVAFVVGPDGELSGFVTLFDVLDELTTETVLGAFHSHVEKTVYGDQSVEEFLSRYRIPIVLPRAKTFSALVEKILGRKPTLHDVVRFGPMELTVKEVGLMGAKVIRVRTL